MATGILKTWLDNDQEDSRIFAEEALLTDVLEAIWENMSIAGVTKTELSNRLNTSKANVSAILNGSRNLTLKTLSNICFALGVTPEITLKQINSNDYYAQDKDYFKVSLIKSIRKPRYVKPMHMRSAENCDWQSVEEVA